MKFVKIVLSVIIVICLAAIAIASFHSVWEIHYLKSFYQGHFSVAEAAYASIVELIKVVLISFPLIVMMCVSLFLITLLHKSGK